MKKKIGILGSGIVAKTLGAGFLNHGFEVMLGTRYPQKLNDWFSSVGKSAKLGTFAEAAHLVKLLCLP